MANPKPRRTAEQTRELLIGIARQLVLERGVSTGVAHIRLQEVLRLAGLTSGAAYRIWSDQEDFQRDLARTIIESRADEPTGSIRAVLHGSGWPATLEESLRLGAGHHMEMFASKNSTEPASLMFLAILALRATAHGDETIAEASRARHERSIADYSQMYTEAMQHYGMKLRGTYTMRQFTTTLAALGEGFALQALEGFEHERVICEHDERNGEEWTLFGCAVVGLVREFFEEDPAAAATA